MLCRRWGCDGNPCSRCAPRLLFSHTTAVMRRQLSRADCYDAGQPCYMLCRRRGCGGGPCSPCAPRLSVFSATNLMKRQLSRAHCIGCTAGQLCWMPCKRWACGGGPCDNAGPATFCCPPLAVSSHASRVMWTTGTTTRRCTRWCTMTSKGRLRGACCSISARRGNKHCKSCRLWHPLRLLVSALRRACLFSGSKCPALMCCSISESRDNKRCRSCRLRHPLPPLLSA